MSANQIWAKIQKGVFIIAEVGKNFIQTEAERSVEEYLANAKQLVDEAAKAGADCVKFQTHNVEDEILDIHIDSPHFPNWKKGRHVWVSRNQQVTPVKEFWLPLKKYCQEKGIVFLSTPMSRGAAKILHEQVGVNFWKIGSGDILDFAMLDYMRNSGLPIIISSGMSTFEEVAQAVEFLRKKNKRVALLHCVSQYPAPPEALRLGTINLLKSKFNLPVGFSDHCVDTNEPDLVAVALGATILEKHFTMSRKLWGPDHKASLEPAEMAALVKAARELENNSRKKEELLVTDFAKRSISETTKELQDKEAIFRPLFRKSLMAGRDIPAGTLVAADMLYAMRPQQFAGGLPSEKYEEVLGKRVKKDLKKFDPITFDVLA